MISLFNILNEIKVNQPGQFKSNDELAYRLKKDPSFKRKLLDSIWHDFSLERDNNDYWDNVIKGWHTADLEQYSYFNVNDEIMFDDGYDNRIYISITPMPEEQDIKQHELILGPNKFYWQYF